MNVRQALKTKMNQPTSQKDCRILNFSPLVCVIIGSILTMVGNTVSLEIFKIIGPVLMTVGGLLLVIIPIWTERRHRLSEDTSCEGRLNSCEQNGEPPSDEGSICQQGSIQQVELWIPSEFLVGPEIVPPSYEESVNNKSTEASSVVSVYCQDEQGSSLDKTSSEPSSDKERRVNV